jgi:hypothetical protein
MNRGIQAGYATAITDDDAISGYGAFTWQDRVYEHIVGALYTRNLNLSDSANMAFSLGVGYRIGDALIPNIGGRIRKHRFAFHYEFNIFRGAANNYNRKAFDLCYSLDL